MHDTPRVLYSSLADPALSHYDMHKGFCKLSEMWSGIKYSLKMNCHPQWQHWLRTCWVSHMWSQAADNHMIIPDVSDFGWKVLDGTLQYDWESYENRMAVQQRVGFLLRECSCSSVTVLWSGL